MQKKDQLIYMRDLIESLYQVVLPAYYNSTCVSSSKVKNLRRILDLQRKLEKRILNSTGQGSGSECVSAEEAYLFTGGGESVFISSQLEVFMSRAIIVLVESDRLNYTNSASLSRIVCIQNIWCHLFQALSYFH